MSNAPSSQRLKPRYKGGVVLDAVAIGKRIRARREQLELSQRETATGLSGVSYAYISRLEAGARLPSFAALCELGEALCVSALWLAFGEHPPDEECPICKRHIGSEELLLPAEGIDAAGEHDHAR